MRLLNLARLEGTSFEYSKLARFDRPDRSRVSPHTAHGSGFSRLPLGAAAAELGRAAAPVRPLGAPAALGPAGPAGPAGHHHAGHRIAPDPPPRSDPARP